MATLLSTLVEGAGIAAAAPETAEGLAVDVEPVAVAVASAQPAAVTSAVEAAVSSMPGSDPSSPAALPLAWSVLVAARRERGINPDVPRTLSTALSHGDFLNTEVVPAAAATAADSPQKVNPLAAEVAVDPITAIVQQIQVFVNIATALAQFVVNQVVQTVVQAVMSIVNFFVPGTTVAVIDTIPLNEPDWIPGDLAVSPDSKVLYVPLTQYGGVAVINIDRTSPTVNTVTTTIGAANGIWSFADAALTPNGKELFLVSRNEDLVLALPTGTGSSQAGYTSINLSFSPRAIAISADGSRAYVTYTNNNGSNVAVINTATKSVIATVPLLGDPNPDYILADGYQLEWYQPDTIALSPNGTRAYVVAGNGLGSKVLVIDTAALRLAASVRVGVDPLDLVASPDGKRIYVANLNSNSVSVIDTATNTVVSTIGGGFPETLAISPDGKKLFVAKWVTTNSNYVSTYSVSVVDTATGFATADITIDGSVKDMAVSPDGERLYITATGSPNGIAATSARILVVDI